MQAFATDIDSRAIDIARAKVMAPYRAQRVAKDGWIVAVWLTATSLVNDAGDIYAIATAKREALKGYEYKKDMACES
ncbi:MAG: hypothetical protein CO013_10175 [Syntrophobacterales bacterium CG_4_8_14_3_um_filter_58_8]|nr:MAG: hypothetical protein COS57_10555 [Syntrophobacterales bacterium CG03_land_8_20_14_0_80_58_14]PJC72267.1 MAG: hypothetical protein CO013_10175 [Syntrophobacterales bacterium CG_4_8_14_3_um_filter_58_8]